MLYKDLEIYLSNDQPTTCPRCGNRTEIISEFYYEEIYSELHKCISKNCQFQFILEEDVENLLNMFN